MTRGAGRQKSAWVLFSLVLVGMVVGAALGEALQEVLPDGVVKRFFVESVSWGVGPGTLNLVVMTFTVGFSVKVNVMSVLGVVLAAYLFRWY